jgi:hypothetical protein
LSETPDNMLYAIANYLYHPARGAPAAFVIWSDLHGENTRGYNLYLEIRKWMGDRGIMIQNKMENPKTSNNISFYFWEIPHATFKQWWIGKRMQRAART